MEVLRGGALGLPEHSTLASSTWWQLCCPHGLAWHSERAASVPVQFTSSSQIWPVPSPCRAPCETDSTVPQPSWRHTTRPSRTLQLSSHTVPHVPLWSTSTRPAQRPGPSTRRSPSGSGEAAPAEPGGEGGEGGDILGGGWGSTLHVFEMPPVSHLLFRKGFREVAEHPTLSFSGEETSLQPAASSWGRGEGQAPISCWCPAVGP